MQDAIRENILNKLEKNIGKPIIIKQTGFIESKFYINKLSYKIEFDTIKIKDEKEEIYIIINLNQIYKFEILNSIKIYVDNDTQIEFFFE